MTGILNVVMFSLQQSLLVMRVLMILMEMVSVIMMIIVHMLDISVKQTLQTTSLLICIPDTVINYPSGGSLKVYVLHDHAVNNFSRSEAYNYVRQRARAG